MTISHNYISKTLPVNGLAWPAGVGLLGQLHLLVQTKQFFYQFCHSEKLVFIKDIEALVSLVILVGSNDNTQNQAPH